MNSPRGIPRSSKQQHSRTTSQWSFPMGRSTASSSIGRLGQMIQSLTKKAWSFSRPSARAMILVLLSVPLYAIVCKRITIHGT
jgi:hypothetical protein